MNTPQNLYPTRSRAMYDQMGGGRLAPINANSPGAGQPSNGGAMSTPPGNAQLAARLAATTAYDAAHPMPAEWAAAKANAPTGGYANNQQGGLTLPTGAPGGQTNQGGPQMPPTAPGGGMTMPTGDPGGQTNQAYGGQTNQGMQYQPMPQGDRGGFDSPAIRALLQRIQQMNALKQQAQGMNGMPTLGGSHPSPFAAYLQNGPFS